MKKKAPTPHLHLIHASAAPVAVVLRRGPGEWSHLSLLNTETDTLTNGAWFNGRIYENSCDLSPDGELFLFKVLPSGKKPMVGRKPIPVESLPLNESGMELRGAWTGLSRPPFLHPIALWPHGNSWDGGGYFTEPRKLTIVSRTALQPITPIQRLVQDEPGTLPVDVSFEYERPHGHVPNVGTCCRDLDGNLICARDGKLFRQIRWQCGKEVEIADLSKLKPGACEIPEWAKLPV